MRVISPLFVDLPRKTKKDKRIYLNLNYFRNLHYVVNNQAKAIYCSQMRKQLKGLVLKTPIVLTFILYRKDKRKGDRANPLSICEKFFCDALVYWKCLKDDTDEYIESSHYYTGEVDRENPRVEIEVAEK